MKSDSFYCPVKPGSSFRLALLGLIFAVAAQAQQYSIFTVAGSTAPLSVSSATGTTIGRPNRVATDSSGNVYFSSLNCVFKLSANGAMTLVAGNSHAGFSGDGGLAVNAELNQPQGVTIDSAGNLYIADSLNNRVRMVSPAGIIGTFAGNGQTGSPGNFGDLGPATAGNLNLPSGVAADATTGRVYIADTANNSIRYVATDGRIHTIAGSGYLGHRGDTSQSTSAELYAPEDIYCDSSGNLFISDTLNGEVREIGTDGFINTIVGNLAIGYAGDGGVSTSASLIEPFSVALDKSANVYIAERYDARIREFFPNNNWLVSTYAGNGTNGFAGDGGPISGAEFNKPTGLAFDSGGNLYVADWMNGRIRKISGGNISTIAGNGGFSYAGDGGTALQALLNGPAGVAVDSSGNTYFSDTNNNVVRKIGSAGVISTVAGNGTAGFGGDGGKATSAQFSAPAGLAMDKSGNLYIADSANSRVRKMATDGTVSTVAGSGTQGYGGDGTAATGAQLNVPSALAFDASGNLYIADFGNSAVRKVTTGGIISTFAGNGTAGYSGDGGKATAAQLNGVQSVAVDSAGNVYIADALNYRVREVNAAGVISTIAGNGYAGYSGDLGPATAAQLSYPAALAVDSAGSVYVSDGGTRIRRISGGIVATVAGTGTLGFSGDGGAAAQAMLNAPQGMAFDAKGNLFVADSGNNAIRELQPLGATTSIAGVTNGASNLTAPLSPGEVVVIYGSGLGPGVLAASTPGANLGDTLAGTGVSIGGLPAPVIYAWSTQVAAVVPFGVSGSSAQVVVQYQGTKSAPATVGVAAASPALFTLNQSGTGQAVAYNQDGTGALNGPAAPIKIGSSILMYITGMGQTNPAGVDGQVATAPLAAPVLPVTATIGGAAATVTYKGEIQGVVNGVMAVVVQIPSGIAAGNAVTVTVTVGGVATQTGVTIAVKN